MDNEEFLLHNFSDINSPLFGDTNINRVYHEAKSKSLTEPTTLASIKQLQSKVESLSKMKERYILRGRRRHYSHRPWLSFGPRHLLLSDLAFLKRLHVSPTQKQSHRTLFLAMDHFSRLIFLKFQKNRSSSETLKSFIQAFNFFTKGNTFKNTYKKLGCDRGGMITCHFSIQLYIPLC